MLTQRKMGLKEPISQQRILDCMKNTATVIFRILQITEKKQTDYMLRIWNNKIKSLQEKGFIQRANGKRNDHWEILISI